MEKTYTLEKWKAMIDKEKSDRRTDEQTSVKKKKGVDYRKIVTTPSERKIRN